MSVNYFKNLCQRLMVLIANLLGTLFTCIVIVVSSANKCWRFWRTIFALLFATVFVVGKFSVFSRAERKTFPNFLFLLVLLTVAKIKVVLFVCVHMYTAS